MRRHKWNLSDEQHANLMNYLGAYPVLQKLYVAKQQLVRFVLLKTLARRQSQIAGLYELTGAAIRQSVASTSGHIALLVTAHCGDVAIHENERHYGGLSQQNGNDVTPSVWFQELRELQNESAGPLWMGWNYKQGSMSAIPR